MSEDAKRNTEILAVSVDPPADLQRAIDRIAMDGPAPTFPFLSDPGHRVIDRYGLFNPDNPRGVPHPTTFVVDREGVVRWKFIEINYKIRPTNDQILAALDSVKRNR